MNEAIETEVVSAGSSELTTSQLTFKEVKDLDAIMHLLPSDWQTELRELWDDYRESSNIYGMYENDTIKACGIAFGKPTPDTFSYMDSAQHYFDRGIKYLGFICVDDKCRGKGYGSKWISAMLTFDCYQRYWLAVDDPSLVKFYEKNHFSISQEIQGADGTEWVMESELLF